MSFLALVLLLIGSLLAIIKRWFRMGFAFSSVSFGLILLVGSGMIPRILLESLQSFPHLTAVSWKATNTIVVLGSGIVLEPNSKQFTSTLFGYPRIYETARLYLECKDLAGRSCTVILSGGDPRSQGITEAEVMRRELKNLGVLDLDIHLEAKSANTFQNAQFSSALLGVMKTDQVLLVASGVQMKRALLYFSHFHTRVIPGPSDRLTAVPSFLPLSYNFTLTDLALHEYVGMARFHAYNYLGLNKNIKLL